MCDELDRALAMHGTEQPRFLSATAIDHRFEPHTRPDMSVGWCVDIAWLRYIEEGLVDLTVLATTILWATYTQRPLVDGNDRLSLCLADEFLNINNRLLMGEATHLYDIVQAIPRLAGGNDREAIHKLAEEMHEHVAAGHTEVPFIDRFPNLMEWFRTGTVHVNRRLRIVP